MMVYCVCLVVCRSFTMTMKQESIHQSKFIHRQHSEQSTLYGKKTASFYFCNNFVKTFYSKIIIGTYILQQIWIKITSESSVSFEAYLYSAL